MDNNKDKSVFPRMDYEETYGGSTHYFTVGGLTKREYFAAMAMQGFCTQHSIPLTAVAEKAVYLADQLIEELGKEAKS